MEAIKNAARAVAECDFLLIATGAGFSADSGLPTYSQIAEEMVYNQQGIDYSDLCRIECLKNNPDLFYGFWGTCFNLYQEIAPHAGYTIIKRWCDHKEQSNQLTVPSYFHYTSNVDGHLRRVGIPKSRIHEIHGCIDQWLVLSHGSKEQSSDSYLSTIDLESSLRFPVDDATRKIDPHFVNKLLGEKASFPQDNISFRPRVLMFDDGFYAHTAMKLKDSSDVYQKWEEQMEVQMSQHAGVSAVGSPKLVVLEIGCGVRVPSVRRECHDVVGDTAQRCKAAGLETMKCCTFIRINPEDYGIERSFRCEDLIDTISIQGAALSTLKAMDEQIQTIWWP